MPDLAPHAAAIFQERSSIELARENQQLRDEFSRQCFLDGTVDIAGPAACNGISPAHAVGHIRDAKQQPHHKEEILVLLTNSSSVDRKDIDMRLPACPAQDIVKCALHFGGKALRIVGDTDDQLAVGSADERQEEMCCVFDSKGSSGEIEFKIALHIEWGPSQELAGDRALPPSANRNKDATCVRFMSFSIERFTPDDLRNDPGYRRLAEEVASANRETSCEEP